MFEILLNLFDINYISIMLLMIISVLVAFNKSERPEGTEWIVLILGLFGILIILNCVYDYAEEMISEGNLSSPDLNAIRKFLYFRAFMEHIIYCLIPFLEVMLIIGEGVKRKLLISIPAVLEFIFEALSMFGIPVVFGYHLNARWFAGPLSFFPYVTSYFYLIILLIYASQLLYIQKNTRTGSVILCISLVTILTGILEFENVITGFMDEIVLIDILIYYEFFFSLYREKIKTQLMEKELEMEQERTALLLAQIRPHFIYNCLSVIRYLCREDSEEAVETIDHFAGYLRRSMEMMTNNACVPFSMEMKLVDDYLYMEKKRFGDKIIITKDIETEDFMIPPLTLQPIVENAIKHGLRQTRRVGDLKITIKRASEKIRIFVEDNGAGFDVSQLKENKERKHIGIDNVRNRLEAMVEGKLTIESEVGKGTKVMIEV